MGCKVYSRRQIPEIQGVRRAEAARPELCTKSADRPAPAGGTCRTRGGGTMLPSPDPAPPPRRLLRAQSPRETPASVPGWVLGPGGAGKAPGTSAPGFLPGPTSGLGFLGGTRSPLPPPPRSQGRLRSRSRRRPPASSARHRDGCFPGSLARLPQGRPPTKDGEGGGRRGFRPGRAARRPRNLHSPVPPSEATRETALLATAGPATAARLRTKAGQRTANYRKASTGGRSATLPSALALRAGLRLFGS